MLGSELMKALEGRYEVEGRDVDELDITSLIACVLDTVADIAPRTVFNAAAYTNVDGCEGDHDTAVQSMARCTKNLAIACKKSNLTMVHFSTGLCVRRHKGSTLRRAGHMQTD
jgi:dTDP-4-dehydrorhamnose reductase